MGLQAITLIILRAVRNGTFVAPAFCVEKLTPPPGKYPYTPVGHRRQRKLHGWNGGGRLGRQIASMLLYRQSFYKKHQRTLGLSFGRACRQTVHDISINFFSAANHYNLQPRRRFGQYCSLVGRQLGSVRGSSNIF